MTENLIFSLGITVPIFLLMVLGGIFRKTGLVKESFAEAMNSFVFKVALPVQLFHDIAETDIRTAWDTRFVLFCFVVTFLQIAIASLLSLPIRDIGLRGEFIQGSYRSSAALLGIAFIKAIYGTSGMGPLMIIGAVPLYNIMAVFVLLITAPSDGTRSAADRSEEFRRRMGGVLRGVVTNPLIIGIVIGLIWSLLRIPMPSILEKTVSDVADLATPMGLISMGASFSFQKAGKSIRQCLASAALKLVGFEAIFLPLAIHMGFEKEKLIAILIMLGSPTTVASYVMARSMRHDGSLTASVVALTTMLSAFTLTLWLFVVKSLGLL